MSELACPWCDAELVLETASAAQQTCSECLTTWLFEDEQVELALAA